MLAMRGQRLEKKMSPVFQARLDRKIANKLYELRLQNRQKYSYLEIFSNYFNSFVENFMKTKSLVGIGVGTALVVILVLVGVSRRSGTGLGELDSLLSNTDKTLNQLEQSLEDLDNIDSSLDDEKALFLAVETTDLDALLKQVDSAGSAADSSISDLDSIDDGEDEISI